MEEKEKPFSVSERVKEIADSEKLDVQLFAKMRDECLKIAKRKELNSRGFSQIHKNKCIQIGMLCQELISFCEDAPIYNGGMLHDVEFYVNIVPNGFRLQLDE